MLLSPSWSTSHMYVASHFTRNTEATGMNPLNFLHLIAKWTVLLPQGRSGSCFPRLIPWPEQISVSCTFLQNLAPWILPFSSFTLPISYLSVMPKTRSSPHLPKEFFPCPHLLPILYPLLLPFPTKLFFFFKWTSFHTPLGHFSRQYMLPLSPPLYWDCACCRPPPSSCQIQGLFTGRPSTCFEVCHKTEHSLLETLFSLASGTLSSDSSRPMTVCLLLQMPPHPLPPQVLVLSRDPPLVSCLTSSISSLDLADEIQTPHQLSWALKRRGPMLTSSLTSHSPNVMFILHYLFQWPVAKPETFPWALIS